MFSNIVSTCLSIIKEDYCCKIILPETSATKKPPSDLNESICFFVNSRWNIKNQFQIFPERFCDFRKIFWFLLRVCVQWVWHIKLIFTLSWHIGNLLHDTRGGG